MESAAIADDSVIVCLRRKAMLRSDAPRAEVIGRSEASDACFGLENRRSRIELPRLHVAGCPGTGTGRLL